MKKNLKFFGFGLKWKNWIDNPIQNPILNLDCQSQSNPLNWIAIRIEQSINPIQQYPVHDPIKRRALYYLNFM